MSNQLIIKLRNVSFLDVDSIIGPRYFLYFFCCRC